MQGPWSAPYDNATKRYVVVPKDQGSFVRPTICFHSEILRMLSGYAFWVCFWVCFLAMFSGYAASFICNCMYLEVRVYLLISPKSSWSDPWVTSTKNGRRRSFLLAPSLSQIFTLCSPPPWRSKHATPCLSYNGTTTLLYGDLHWTIRLARL